MISIIMPFYNAEKYLSEAIRSVIFQTYKDWELLLINDGSNDKSKTIALSFLDPRISYFEQENKGVSAARNIGLTNMLGDYFCFLDADDVLPKNSLTSRRSIFDINPAIKYVDGTVLKMNSDLSEINEIWKPNLNGNPLYDLVNLSGKSFFGPTWMIKREFNHVYSFEEDLRFSEDLFFYMKLAKEGGHYSYTNESVLCYRNTPDSAMKNLIGLESGYRFIEERIKNWKEIDRKSFRIYQYRYKRSMFLSYLRAFQPLSAIKSIL